ncbi:MAG: hemolysin III family protein [Rhodothermales bacterium]|nr:hemolysin III family protein [Rhodothermales bacterium]
MYTTDLRRPQSISEEIANSISHGAGLVLAIIAAPFLISTAISHGLMPAVGAGVFIGSAILLYLSSLVYHALPRTKLKSIFQIVDHTAIYVLIAGTYTPFTMGVLNGTFGWTMLGVVWSMALAGIIFKLATGIKYPKTSVAIYLLMGWTIILAIKPMLALMPFAGLIWIAAGGFFYTVGVIFFAMDQIKYFHFIWHLFVLAGTACHFVAVFLYAF